MHMYHHMSNPRFLAGLSLTNPARPVHAPPAKDTVKSIEEIPRIGIGDCAEKRASSVPAVSLVAVVKP
jgi:hypothetical protein